MKYPRPVTSVHQLELSSECNLRCKYCPHPHLERTKEHMQRDTFDAALDWIKYLEKQGTQNELALTGMGEAIMHPDFKELALACRKVISGRITLSTNGVAFTEEIAEACSLAAVEVFVSAHRPEKAGLAIELAKSYGLIKDVNGAAMVSAFDWAGQVNWFTSAPQVWCDYLRKGWCVILVNGDVTTCCIDAHGKHVFASVLEDTPQCSEFGLGVLCPSCHMKPPPEE